MYLLQLMGPQCAQFSDGIYNIMQFADEEYADFFMDLTVDSYFEYTVGALTVSLGSALPLQIPIWNFPQMTSIAETVGEGWHPKRHEFYFIPKDKQHLRRIEPCMMTAKQYEAAYIKLSTIQEIKVNGNGDIHQFQVKCKTQYCMLNNHELHSQHKKLFQYDTYKFEPSDELVRSMPFKFIHGFNHNTWMKLEKGWMNKLNLLLQQADSQTIKIIELVRIVHTWDIFSLSSTAGFGYIYQVIDTSSNSYNVYQEQINEIIGDQEWLNGDMNCLLNLAANRRLSLSMGTKKGDTNKESISTVGYGIGNLVGVNKHGDKWDHKAYLTSVDLENGFASVK
jgi:hypothetical protein